MGQIIRSPVLSLRVSVCVYINFSGSRPENMHGRGHGPMVSKCPPREFRPEGPRRIGGEVLGGCSEPRPQAHFGPIYQSGRYRFDGIPLAFTAQETFLAWLYETGGRAKLGGGMCPLAI